MKRIIAVSMAVVLVILTGLITAVSFTSLDENRKQKQFLVGVTFCGNTSQDAKLLIDRVKNYTNLLVLQSGDLMADENAVKEIGDYAVSNGLHFAAYFSPSSPPKQASWLNITEQRWGEMFAGLYYGDEPGGKMLDANVILSQMESNETIGNSTVTIVRPNIIKFAGGAVLSGDTTYYPDGRMIVLNTVSFTTATYYPNGTITLQEMKIDGSGFFTKENGTDRISKLESYETVSSRNPLSNCGQAAEVFKKRNSNLIDGLSNYWQLGDRSFPIFTADYGLYWWDFESGYDLVLAELGWNNSAAQEIGLVRGAANLQGKSWGTMITWTYTQTPYLTTGNEMYEQMRMSYESGAEYIVIFNYAEDMERPYGILQLDHFGALERFWNEVVKNPAVVHGGIRAETAFVLPKDYGWGLRNQNDTVWGLWSPTGEARQAWTLLQNALAKHDLQLDIVYDDLSLSIAGKYRQVCYWRQTG